MWNKRLSTASLLDGPSQRLNLEPAILCNNTSASGRFRWRIRIFASSCFAPYCREKRVPSGFAVTDEAGNKGVSIVLFLFFSLDDRQNVTWNRGSGR